ncbi:hypothetical protein SEA_VINCENZO_43 [Mycobacterium phage Vincenzo]|uniref:Uncharacterized protein n=2 Tax=Coopervirus vincenzo TaxID=1983110 RepID=A0A0F6YQ20_9CAUD|nr:hypothetical protein SEA_VINCENZO_43 [Mycobacterium phage Vincenzo]AKF14305.1 hypothetical protein SEA_VINCENZO_43 [Mycobacterium phage Vincenzo]AKF14709.1 hypothetical protein SEA_ALANGRANT_44 [Mycobacterium phage AlanGrant]
MGTPFDTISAQADAHGAVQTAGDPAAYIKPASPASVDYLRALMTEKAQASGADMLAAQVSIDMYLENNGSQRTVSANIDRLKAEGYTGRAKAPAADTKVAVPAGRYAIDTQVHAVNGTAFYKVDRPETGRWAGYVFVKQVIGGDEQKLSMKQGRAILSRIAAAGAEVASARYGHEIGECGVCGRQLTNDDSRARGIGPVCADKMGW